ncbi:YbdD/YjiX family protein [Lysobacter sp. S4-A87]|uniref:YbdD/YjiX family protein n=1 Tax=Lysobacter sp. S4-A87 TaxID=2925843 RepID=UPI001F53D3D6|nr:CstA-like transporter-associated (seleno)protein [Lysobacter sp. S4-A87]UNK50630.1 YbdD/YjiX family protein [Lysobacter sp. S4-A87]
MSRSMRSLADTGTLALELLARWWRAAAQTARLAIGIPDYDNYVEHVQRNHPDRLPMSRDEFFHERMMARYGKGRSRCC